MQTPDDQETIDLEIANVVAKWMDLHEKDRTDWEELVRQYPNLAPGLEECLKGLMLVQSGSSRIQFKTEYSEGSVSNFPTVPDFEILSELGRGGMGIVYEAHQLSLGRTVALKILPIGSVDPRAIERFQHEAETVAALCHPGIVPVFAVGVHNGLHWYAMQKVDGCPLSQWFAERPMESKAAAIQEVVRIGIEAAEALEHAHQRGVIHRDVKPGNLLVEKSGKVWLTDFGLARRDLDVTATATGAMLGTPRYMSAEQISNREELIDARTDIYSLGATLYEMATGRPPFDSQSPLELLTQIQRDEPTALRKKDPSIPIPLELVILKCLDKEPQRRYPTAAALADDLKAVRDHLPITAKGLPVWVTASRFLKRNQKQAHAIATSVALTGLAIAMLALLWQQNQQASTGQLRIHSPAGLYVANIHSKKGSTETSSLVVTTPMQQPISLPSGEYSVRMDGNARPSQTLDVQVRGRDSVDVQYVDRREAFPEVDILGKLAMPISEGALAVLGKESLEVFEPGGTRRFTKPIAVLDSLFQDDSAPGKPKAADDPSVSFSYSPEQKFQGDHSVEHSGFARIERISQAQVDLNADGKPDLLLAAGRHAALTALAHDGSVLWSKRLKIEFEPSVKVSAFPRNMMPVGSIVGISPIDDLNGDGIAELAVNAALFHPSGLSRPAIFTLSGRDGTQIASTGIESTSIPTIRMGAFNSWPWAGLLPHGRDFDADNRTRRNIFSSVNQFPMRNRTSSIDYVRWGGVGMNSALYVLPPLVFGEHEGHSIAATATYKSIHFFDLADGRNYSQPIALPNPICLGPTKVRLPDGKWGVTVVTGIPGNTWTTCEMHLCVIGDASPRWSGEEKVSAMDLVAGAEKCSFPLVVDLNSDGVDEILFTRNENGPYSFPNLDCYSVTDDNLLWSSPPLIGISQVVEQAIRISDIDKDQFHDIAVVGISPQKAPEAPVANGEFQLVVEFLSGRTGKRIGYRHERISGQTKSSDVFEIDSAKLIGNELVCSIVHGSNQELKLASTTIAIDLQHFSVAQVSTGLTRFGAPTPTRTSEEGAWYRRRSGEFARPSDAAVWVPPSRHQAIFATEQLVQSWISPSGEPRVLLHSQEGLRCVNPLLKTTVWRMPRSNIDSKSIFCMMGKNGQTDLVMPKSIMSNAEPAIYDAETGTMQFQITGLIMGELRSVELNAKEPNRFAYLFANGNTIYNGKPRTPAGFLLLKIDRLNKRLVWSKTCLNSIDATHSFVLPPKPIFSDISRDGNMDLIVSNTLDDHVALEAIDGNNGQPIWTVPLVLPSPPKTFSSANSGWPTNAEWPILRVVPGKTRDYLVVVDSVSNDQQAFEVKCLEMQTGKLLSSFKQSLQMNLEWAGRFLIVEPISPSNRDGRLGIKASLPNGKETWFVLQIDDGKGALSEVDRFQVHSNMLTADVDGDSILDIVDINGKKVDVFRGDNHDSLASFDLPTDFTDRGIELIDRKAYLVGSLPQQQGHLWFELPSGALTVKSTHGFQGMTKPVTPRLLRHSSGTLLVGQTPEYPLCVEVDFGDVIQKTPEPMTQAAFLDPSTDLRYRQPVRPFGVYQERTLGDIVTLSLISVCGILVPAFYLLQLVRDRQWSLRQLLFGPIVVMIALFALRSSWLYEPPGLTLNLIVGSTSALSLLAIVYLLLGQHWRILAIGVGMSMGFGVVTMLISQVMLSGGNGYWTISNWLTSSLAAGFQLIVPFAAAPWWMKNMKKKRLP